MIVWFDAQLSPQRAVVRVAFRRHRLRGAHLGLRDTTDRAIYDAARAAGVVVITKDRDFPDLLARLGPPPQVKDWFTRPWQRSASSPPTCFSASF
jgi:predicted nuclease of predicted toxin-antitoxin system